MDNDTFRRHFATFAEAPDSTAKLRKLILELAVQGKLVPHDPRDESAAHLLAAVGSERRSRSPGDSHSSQKTSERLAGPYPLPAHWCWARLSDVLRKLNDGAHHVPPHGPRGDFRFITAKNIRPQGISLHNVTYIDRQDHAAITARCNPEPGDVLYVKDGGTTGHATINDLAEPFSLASSVALLKVSRAISNRYLLYVLRSPYFGQMIQAEMAGVAITRISLGKLGRALIPLPPLAEQLRIAARVDELLRLCDELEARQTARDAARRKVVSATLARLVAPVVSPIVQSDSALAIDSQPVPPARAPAHLHTPRLRQHFDLLFDTPATVRQLRQTILELAIQGRLVPQNPYDEPATILLQQIARHRETAGGRRRKLRALPALHRAADLPPGWTIARLSEMTLNRDSARRSLTHEVRQTRQGPYDYYGASGIIDSVDAYLFDKPLLLVGEDGANLINRSTPIAFIAKGKYWVNNHAHVLDGLSLPLLEYLEVYLNAIDLTPWVTGSIQPKMNQARLSSIPIRLPPAAEQLRIVARARTLIPLCDTLATQLSKAESASAKLLTAAVANLLRQPALPACAEGRGDSSRSTPHSEPL